MKNVIDDVESQEEVKLILDRLDEVKNDDFKSIDDLIKDFENKRNS